MQVAFIRTAQQQPVTDPKDACMALMAAFSHFGSLTEGVDGAALAVAMVGWVQAERELQRTQSGALTERVFHILWSATTEDHTTAEFAHRSITLRTPTSGTKISLGFSSGSYIVEVDFGAEGSETRAMSILATAELDHASFQAYDLERQPIGRRAMLDALADDALRQHDRLVRCPEIEFPSNEARELAIHRLHARVGFFNACS